MAAKVTFLDFDVALNPISAADDAHFSQARLLAETLAGFEDIVQVVISSDKRGYFTLDDMKAMLPAELTKYVVGVTPLRGGNRLEEIRDFVAENAPDADWRALDDGFMSFPKGFPQLIRCNGFVGVDDKSESTLRTWLTDKQSWR